MLTHGDYLRKMVVRLGNRSLVIDESEIACFMSREPYTSLHTLSSSEYICNLSLNHLSQRLDPNHFVRLHRNSIARIDAIAAILSRDRMAVTLRNGFTLPVSRHRRKGVRNHFPNLS